MFEWLSPLARADDAALLWMHRWFGRSEVFDRTVQAFVERPTLRFGLFGAMFIWLWFRSDKEQAKTRARLIGIIATCIVATALPRALSFVLPFRERPFARAELGLALPPDFLPDMRTWSAFPSDHAVLGFAMATGIWLISRRLGVLAYIYAALAICAPRMYFGLHHPTDIVVGALIGVVVALAMERSRWTDGIASKVLSWESHRPEVFYLTGFVLLSQMSYVFSALRVLALMTFSVLRGA